VVSSSSFMIAFVAWSWTILS